MAFSPLRLQGKLPHGVNVIPQQQPRIGRNARHKPRVDAPGDDGRVLAGRAQHHQQILQPLYGANRSPLRRLACRSSLRRLIYSSRRGQRHKLPLCVRKGHQDNICALPAALEAALHKTVDLFEGLVILTERAFGRSFPAAHAG